MLAKRIPLIPFGLFLALLAVLPAQAAEPTLTLRIGERTVTLARAALLKHPAVADIDIPADVAYRGPMRYRAVPLAALFAGFDLPPTGALEAAATDGFVAQIPLGPALGRGKARAYVAIEPADKPWPPLPGKQQSAGPFYVVWLDGAADGIGPEQWPYMLATLAVVLPPAQRWPQIAVDAALPKNDPARAGQDGFIKHCLACHRINGGGGASIGPDMNLPMNPVEYFQPAALRRYLRDPASVRHWPEQKMPGFAREQLSDSELEQIIAYLQHMSHRKTKQ